MNRLLLVAPMLIFGICGIGLWMLLINPDLSGPFHDDLVPELISFCIEGFILIGLLTLIQHSREQARRRELWLSLRGSFRDLLSCLDIAFLEPNGEPAASRELETDPKVIDRMIEQLAKKHPDLDSLIALRREGEETLALTRDLVAVAAQLSATHMNWWIAIVDSIRRLSEARDRESLEHSAHEMLVNIREFDRLDY
ncbi:hypothetical protein [Wenzhouxiangella marina]|uniref:Uncharacterized protein n=1 Tax=Wenzhouxiangella marina TaxID=1579979 RepID=A0A0K0XZM1_9GAMM|nr:hypothetical protein [Wenzhouxiangella marina]AKS43087.1 hypothetical protein WM2015_2729 [Wenzhouxiangella marina]MBB6087229.1 hypothetical protein [Wenzhouxiangella marina]